MIERNRENESEVVEFWGTVPDSMLTLFKSISGGVSWHQPSRLLRRQHVLLEYTFAAYISVTIFAVLNVVTGVFCNGAIETAQRDPAFIAQLLSAKRRRAREQARQLFEEMDVENRGHMTLQELEHQLSTEKCKAQFAAMGIEPTDAWTLFKLLDSNKDHYVDLDEFWFGTMKLSGSATALDIAQITMENRIVMKQMEKLVRVLESELSVILDAALHRTSTSKAMVDPSMCGQHLAGHT